MGSFSAGRLLHAPVRLHGIRLGQPVDVLLDPSAWRALGFVVLCGDETERFLPWAAARPGEADIEVESALMLLEDVGFYRARAGSFRELRGREVERDGETAGPLRDVLLGADGSAGALVVASGGRERRLDPDGAVAAGEHASAA